MDPYRREYVACARDLWDGVQEYPSGARTAAAVRGTPPFAGTGTDVGPGPGSGRGYPVDGGGTYIPTGSFQQVASGGTYATGGTYIVPSQTGYVATTANTDLFNGPLQTTGEGYYRYGTNSYPQTTSWVTGGSYRNINSYRQRPSSQIVSQTITAATIPLDHPDPDARLGEIFDDMRERLVRNIMAENGHATPEEVWNNWTFTATTNAAAADPWDSWRISLRADYHGDNVEPAPTYAQWSALDAQRDVPTEETWAAWEHGVQVFTGRDSVVPPRPTQEMLRRTRLEDARLRMVRENRHRAHRLRQRIAARRAQELLAANLDETQRADMERANGFRVITPQGNTYWVAKGHVGNVYLLNNQGNRVESLCIHARDQLPDEDHMLAQKLLLETDEPNFRRIANITRQYGQGPSLLVAA